eukprot:CAMPEP_0184011982 /NCGR_PEP_ID=MMETSP0954-20121128/4130_1 /TAXON_ID=627963 /ORGANISM="Aplanochytrium sp, Strain PBS07" /LENGTH=514 /DNA_ID=CAMNT_0026291861 /DNA_START=512 /DNA_END=2053 /DNA_ORIENTATION=-
MSGGTLRSVFENSSGKIVSIVCAGKGFAERLDRIPSGFIRKYESLEVIDLSNNLLSGSIPESFADLATLKELNLGLNRFSGSIPDSIGRLGNLTLLNIGSNLLNGKIPDQLDNLKKLKKVYLLPNEFSGAIPTFAQTKCRRCGFYWGGIFFLSFFQILIWWCVTNVLLEGRDDQNKMKERLTKLLAITCGLTVASCFVLGVLCDYDKFEFNVHCKSNLDDTDFSVGGAEEYLHFSGTSLFETPAGCSVSWIVKLVREGFSLFSEEKYSFDSHTFNLECEGANLSDSSTFAAVFNSFGDSRWGRVLGMDLAGNNLEKIPDPVFDALGLRSLDVSHNQISGKIPAELGRLSRMESLNLENNQFIGPIPEEIGQLPRLQSFFVLPNNFTVTNASNIPAFPQECRECRFFWIGILWSPLPVAAVFILLNNAGLCYFCVNDPATPINNKKDLNLQYKKVPVTFLLANFTVILVFIVLGSLCEQSGGRNCELILQQTDLENIVDSLVTPAPTPAPTDDRW